jgi:hypothetical protein
MKGIGVAEMVLKARVGIESEKCFPMMTKRISKEFHFARSKELYSQNRTNEFSSFSQGLNQSLVVTRLAGARLAPQL